MNNSDRAIELIFEQLKKAEQKHPWWPDDYVAGIGIITEEVGEAMKEALELTFDKLSTKDDHYERLMKETAQTAAMGIRMMIFLCEKQQSGACQKVPEE